MMTAAAAPFVAAVILECTSPTAVFLLLALVAGVAAALIPLTMPHRDGVRRTEESLTLLTLVASRHSLR